MLYLGGVRGELGLPSLNDRQIPEILRESPVFVPGIARFHPGNRPVSSRVFPVGIPRAGQHFEVQLGKFSTWKVVRLQCVDVLELII